MKLIVIILLALQTVHSFSFPSATLFPIPESTTESTTKSEAPPKRVSQEALYSALRDNSSEDLLTYRMNSITFEFPRALSDATFNN